MLGAMTRPLALAVDFGGTKVEAALVDDRGRLVPGSRHRRPTGPDVPSAALDASVRDAVEAARAVLPAGASLAGVGIGAAGPVDVDGGLVSPLNLPAWRDHPLAAVVAAVVPDAPVTLRIDGLCIALAEHWVGAGRGVPNMLGMIVSTGVGGGLVLGGRAAPSPRETAATSGTSKSAGSTTPAPAAVADASRRSPQDRAPSRGPGRRGSPARRARSSPSRTRPTTRSPSQRSPVPAAPSDTPSHRRPTSSTSMSSRSAAASRASPPRSSSMPAPRSRSATPSRSSHGCASCPRGSPTRVRSSARLHSCTDLSSSPDPGQEAARSSSK